MFRLRFWSALFALPLLLHHAATPAAAQAAGQPVLGLVQGTNTLVRFNTATPGTLGTSVTVTGLAGGETLKAIDYRPATGVLYGLAADNITGVVRLYTLNTTTGAATPVGGALALPAPGTFWDINFNPVVDRIRVVSSEDENARLHPETGTLVADDTNLTPPTVAIDSVAYSTPTAGAMTTTLYALNRATNSLALIGGVSGIPSPNAGMVTDIGPLGVDFAAAPNAMDIATNNTAFAVLRPASGATSVYQLNLTTGAATLLGALGDGTLAIDDIAIVDPALTLSPPTGTYTTRQSFDLVMLTEAQGRVVVSGTVTFDGTDVTGFIASCIRPGAGAGGIVSFRCPGIGGPVVGAGMHTLQVQLMLNDGTVAQRSVRWMVVPIAEP